MLTSQFKKIKIKNYIFKIPFGLISNGFLTMMPDKTCMQDNSKDQIMFKVEGVQMQNFDGC